MMIYNEWMQTHFEKANKKLISVSRYTQALAKMPSLIPMAYFAHPLAGNSAGWDMIGQFYSDYRHKPEHRHQNPVPYLNMNAKSVDIY